MLTYTADVTDLDGVARRLADLAAAHDAYMGRVERGQIEPDNDLIAWAEVDRMLAIGEPVPAGSDSRARAVEARTIGHLLNDAGDFHLMYAVAEKVAAISDHSRVIEGWWSGIGVWRG